MNRRTLTSWFAGCCLAMAGAASAHAQAMDAFCEPAMAHDMQLFAPVDFDFDCQPIKDDAGWFFRYSRVSWFVSGERTPLGSPNAIALSEIIFPVALALDFGDTPPPPYVIQNGIQDVNTGQFGWGNRYEFGYTDGQAGWEFGLIERHRMNQARSFGEGPQTSGFGSIHVNFELSNPRLLEGFRDYNGQLINGIEVPTATIGGPGVGGNGIADDLDGDLNTAFGFTFIDTDGNGVFDPGDDIITGIFIDYGDLHTFNVTFNQVNIRNTTETDGVEIMRMFSLDNRHEFVKNQNAHTEIGAGVRFLRVRDQFVFTGTSDFLRGTNFIDTQVDNLIVGPQIHARYEKQIRRFNVGVDGRFVFGYNVQNLDQSGAFGNNLLPGGLNQPANLQPTTFVHGQQANSFTPLAELRLDLAYQVTGSMALKLGYTAIFMDNITRASSVTRWFLPDGGFTETSAQNFLLNGADAGIEFVY